MSEFKKILVTLDGSALSEGALDPAVMLARNSGAKLVLLRVLVPLYLWAPFMEIEPNLEVARSRHEAETVRYLDEVKNRVLVDHPNLRVETVALHGPVAEAIVDYATGEDVDLIVMSSHGRSGISRWVHGSVAEKVLQGARCCSTMLVRGEALATVETANPAERQEIEVVDQANHV